MILITSRALLLSMTLAAKGLMRRSHSPSSSGSSEGSGHSSTHYCNTAAYLAAQGEHDDGAALPSHDHADAGLFGAALAVLPYAHDRDGALLTDGLLAVCELTAPIVGAHGPLAVGRAPGPRARRPVRARARTRGRPTPRPTRTTTPRRQLATPHTRQSRSARPFRWSTGTSPTTSRCPPPPPPTPRESGPQPGAASWVRSVLAWPPCQQCALIKPPDARPLPHNPPNGPPHNPPKTPQRIRARKATDPERFRVLFLIVEDEVARRDDNHSQSCTKAVLWLKR